MKIYFTVIALLLCSVIYAQEHNLHGKQTLWKGKENTADSNTLLHAFKHGKFNGHFRYFFMVTDNKKGLKDFYANALGGGIKYETASFHGFQLGLSGFFIFDIGSSNLAKPDSVTGQLSRYELALFDLTHPDNRSDIDRLEELYLKYNWKKFNITIGKQLLNTPFINMQDSRMRPTEAGGIYARFNELKNTKIEGGYIYELSPRATVEWYSAAESIGVYSQGVNSDGTKAAYAGNLKSKGIALLGIEHKNGKYFTLKLHELFVENIFNTALLQTDFAHPISKQNSLIAAIQYIRQDAINDGGNSDPSKTYFDKNGKSNIISTKLGMQTARSLLTVNYTRITADGKFLMPREWGTEPLFTYLARERNEGLGDVDAINLRYSYTWPKANIKIQTGLGYYRLPDVHNYRLNKYGLPSYHQFNVDIRHEFKGHLKGFGTQFLFVYKGNSGQTYHSNKYVINKVNTTLWNCIINYHF